MREGRSQWVFPTVLFRVCGPREPPPSESQRLWWWSPGWPPQTPQSSPLGLAQAHQEPRKKSVGRGLFLVHYGFPLAGSLAGRPREKWCFRVRPRLLGPQPGPRGVSPYGAPSRDVRLGHPTATPSCLEPSGSTLYRRVPPPHRQAIYCLVLLGTAGEGSPPSVHALHRRGDERQRERVARHRRPPVLPHPWEEPDTLPTESGASSLLPGSTGERVGAGSGTTFPGVRSARKAKEKVGRGLVPVPAAAPCVPPPHTPAKGTWGGGERKRRGKVRPLGAP